MLIFFCRRPIKQFGWVHPEMSKERFTEGLKFIQLKDFNQSVYKLKKETLQPNSRWCIEILYIQKRLSECYAIKPKACGSSYYHIFLDVVEC